MQNHRIFIKIHFHVIRITETIHFNNIMNLIVQVGAISEFFFHKFRMNSNEHKKNLLQHTMSCSFVDSNT